MSIRLYFILSNGSASYRVASRRVKVPFHILLSSILLHPRRLPYIPVAFVRSDIYTDSGATLTSTFLLLLTTPPHAHTHTHPHPCHAARQYPVHRAGLCFRMRVEGGWIPSDARMSPPLPPLFAQHFVKGEAQKPQPITFTLAAFIQAALKRSAEGASECKRSSERCWPCPPLFSLGSGVNEPVGVSVGGEHNSGRKQEEKLCQV